MLRNSRDGNYPSPLSFAALAIAAGANGITVHPRPDQRHIRANDVGELADLVKQHAGVEFNVEGNPFERAHANYPGFLQLVDQVQPHQCTLVPDTQSQLTSDHGFDLTRDFDALAPIVRRLKSRGIRVSLFMDPAPQQIALAKQVGADRVELYTGPFAWAFQRSPAEAENVFATHCAAAQQAHALGLGINAGHDLNLKNMQVYKTLPWLQEVSIGHALTVDALLLGFDAAVKAYLQVCS